MSRWMEEYERAEKAERRIKELEDGFCRFNCRSQKEAFIAGYCEAQECPWPAMKKEAADAYNEWLKDKD